MFQDRIDKNVQGIRDRWLVFNIICMLYSILSGTLFVLFGFIQNSHLAFVMSVNIIIFTLLYYFAYRKPGTRFLSYLMYSKFVGLLGTASLISSITFPEPQILNDCVAIIDFFFLVGWFFLSFHLRKVNLNEQPLYKAMKKKKVKKVLNPLIKAEPITA